MNRLQLVPPPPSDPDMWRKLMQHLYLCEEDRLFEWLRGVRQEVLKAEKEESESAA